MNAQLYSKIRVVAQKTYLEYWLDDFVLNTKFNDTYGFKYINNELGEQIMVEIVSKLYESKLIGSGWSFDIPFENPAFLTDQNYAIVYD